MTDTATTAAPAAASPSLVARFLSNRSLRDSTLLLVLAGGIYVPPLLLANAQAQGWQPSEAPAAEGAPSRSIDGLRNLLTERQIDVMRLLSQGKPNKLIARDLGISEGTVKIHLAAIFRALNVRNRVEAVVASRKLQGL